MRGLPFEQSDASTNYRKSNSARERQQASQCTVFRQSELPPLLPHPWVTMYQQLLLFISSSCLTRLISFYPSFSLFSPSHRVAAARRVAASHAARALRAARRSRSAQYFLFFFIFSSKKLVQRIDNFVISFCFFST